jgi:hypothetical protein
MHMADFNLEEAQQFQTETLSRVREMQRMLDTEVTAYYSRDRVDNEADYYENLQGLRNYLKDAYGRLDRVLTDIDRRLG